MPQGLPAPGSGSKGCPISPWLIPQCSHIGDCCRPCRNVSALITQQFWAQNPPRLEQSAWPGPRSSAVFPIPQPCSLFLGCSPAVPIPPGATGCPPCRVGALGAPWVPRCAPHSPSAQRETLSTPQPNPAMELCLALRDHAWRIPRAEHGCGGSRPPPHCSQQQPVPPAEPGHPRGPRSCWHGAEPSRGFAARSWQSAGAVSAPGPEPTPHQQWGTMGSREGCPWERRDPQESQSRAPGMRCPRHPVHPRQHGQGCGAGTSTEVALSTLPCPGCVPAAGSNLQGGKQEVPESLRGPVVPGEPIPHTSGGSRLRSSAVQCRYCLLVQPRCPCTSPGAGWGSWGLPWAVSRPFPSPVLFPSALRGALAHLSPPSCSGQHPARSRAAAGTNTSLP